MAFTSLIEIDKFTSHTNFTTGYEDTQYKPIILNIFNGNTVENENNDPIIFNFIGTYHHEITKDFVEMASNYLLAINLHYIASMVNYGVYHQYVSQNHVDMEKCYLMVAELGDICAIH